MKIRLFALAVILIALLCLAPPALAQGDRGTITGLITDATGAVIPNVEVIATQLETNLVSKATTTPSGVFRIPYLPAGNYKVSATLKGFKTAVVSPVVVAVATVVTADLRLELGLTTDSVTVNGEATKLESSSSDLGYSASALDYHDWAISANDDGQRQIGNFIFSALPGTSGDTYLGSINGSPTGSHDVYIEGITVGRADLSGSTSEFQPSVDAISEFRLQTGALNASYGGGLTAVANYNAKSGTNQLHGTVYDYFINDKLDANSFDNNAYGLGKGWLKENNWGTAVGGPLWLPKIYDGRNKTFWFFNYEGTAYRAGHFSGYRTLPTAAFRQGDFSALPQAIFDPESTVQNADGSYTRTAFGGNIIPVSRVSTVSANILKLTPPPDPTLPGFIRNMPAIPGQPSLNLHDLMWKVDQTITDKQKLSFYLGDNTRARDNPGGHAYAPIPGNATSTANLQTIIGRMIRASDDWTITPSLLNHFAFGYNNFDNFHDSLSTGQNWPSKIGLNGVSQLTFPVILFSGAGVNEGSGLTQWGNNSTANEPNGSYIFMNDTTWVHGKHAIRFGAEIRKYFYTQAWNWGASGSFTFDSKATADPNNLSNTGYSFASFLLGDVYKSSVPVTYIEHTTVDTWNPAFYVSDDWKVSRRLTINMGLRWEIAGAQKEIHGVSSSFDPTAPNPGADGYPGALAFLADTHRDSWQNAFYGEVGPRFGLAYQISNKVVLRAGYSLMYEPPIANNWGAANIDGYSSCNCVNNHTARNMSPVYNWDSGYPAYAFTLPDKDPTLDNGSGIIYTAPNSARQPYAHNVTVGLQYLLGDKTLLQANYVATRGRRLDAGVFGNMNQLNPKYLSLGDALLDDISMHPEIKLPYPSFTGSVAQALLPYPQYYGGGVLYQYPYFGKSSYNALQVTATRRLSGGLGFLISYSFQKTLTNTDSAHVYYGGQAQDVYNRGLEKSVASFDHPQNLRLTWIYELPFGKGHHFLNKGGVTNAVLGGWTFTANQQYQSGDPLSIWTSIDTSSYLFNGTNYNGGGIRADVIPGVPLTVPMSGHLDVAGGTGIQYINPAAFASPPVTANGVVARLGDSPRNFGNLRGPWQPSENFGIFKRFSFGESRFVEARADAFNAFNRSGLADPITTVGDPQFGQIVDVADGPREIQLALRLTF